MSQGPDSQAIQLTSSLDHVDLARDFVAEIARTVPMSPKEIYDLELVVTEALTNVTEHAYEGDEGMRVELAVIHEADALTIVISHDGHDFDPASQAEPVMREYLAERRVGGLGLLLMKKLMDEVEYSTGEDGVRRIRLVKRRATGPEGA
ncbi:MAG: ATP-binding protein [Candidatus Sericytochromatia bacterium]